MTSRKSWCWSTTPKLALLAQDLGRPDECPNHNTQNDGQGIKDVEPEFDGSERSIVPLGKLGYSENTSDLVVSTESSWVR
jgi:hypothetical protein